MTVRNVAPDVIDIYWTEGACHDHAAVEVSANTRGVNVIVRLLRRRPFECPAIGLSYRLTLRFSQDVDADDVSASRVEME